MILRKMLPRMLDMLNSRNVILASGSPRRQEMLQKVVRDSSTDALISHLAQKSV